MIYGTTSRRRRSRGGFTLIEMLVVITAVTFVLGIIITVMGALSKADRASRQDRTDAARIAETGALFRRAAHRAIGVEPAPEFAADGPLDRIRFDLGRDGWLEFRRDGNALEIHGERAADEAGNLLVPQAQRAVLSPDRDSAPPRLGLIHRDGRLVAVLSWTRSRGPAWSVEAVVGRDRLDAETPQGGAP
jgi:prepilin-type N-terminal cleavage/methylation domain-containing protein